jgi:hypothetical protein
MINLYNSAVTPSTVHVKNTGLARFFKRYLLQEAFSVFDWKMPETWDRNYFLYVLYVAGYIGIIDTDKFGVIPQHGGLGGYTVFYQPQYMLINNPLFDKTYKPIINEECVCLRLEPDYCGIYDIVDYYGDLMALCAEAAAGNLLNSKLAFIFAADNKATAESLKKLYDQVSSGEPAVFADKNLFDDDGNLRVTMFNQDVGGNFIADRLLDTMRTIRCQFLTDIGIPNANTDKKERLITDEVNANNFETRAKCSLWLDELKDGCRKARDMFGIDLSVDWRKDLKEDESDERINNSADLDL